MPDLLSLNELRAHLRRITYRPGWRLALLDGTWEGPELQVQATVEDSYHPGRGTDLDIRTFVPPQQSLAGFERWLCWRLARIESHECREWLKLDDTPIFDPHAATQRPAPIAAIA